MPRLFNLIPTEWRAIVSNVKWRNQSNVKQVWTGSNNQQWRNLQRVLTDAVKYYGCWYVLLLHFFSAELPNMLNLKPSFFRPLDNISFLLLSNIAFYLKCVSEKMQPTSIRDSCGNDNIWINLMHTIWKYNLFVSMAYFRCRKVIGNLQKR